MSCPLCERRKGKRACPAVGRQICSTCCGTKRLKEIACPADCVYLASARIHPAAAVQRQRERDVALVIRSIDGLSEAQMGLLSRLHQELRAYRPTAIPALVDADVREAAGAMASTLETAARGILYEHQAASLPAQRLVARFRDLQAEAEARGKLQAAALAMVFRRLEAGARDAAALLGGAETALLDFVDRFLAGSPAAEPGAEPADRGERAPERLDAPRIIVP
jgi:hypothetical protein